MYYYKKLEYDEIVSIYQNHMKNDFPRNELKPLSMIEKSLSKNQYECFGIFKNNVLYGYAYFAFVFSENKKYYLLDYFAAINGKRGQGIGSEFLRLIKNNITDAEMIICESENPACCTAEEYDIRNRRVNFYLRNGFTDTKVTSEVFGVNYILLELDFNNPHNTSEVSNAYSMLYKSFLPPEKFSKFIKVFD